MCSPLSELFSSHFTGHCPPLAGATAPRDDGRKPVPLWMTAEGRVTVRQTSLSKSLPRYAFCVLPAPPSYSHIHLLQISVMSVNVTGCLKQYDFTKGVETSIDSTSILTRLLLAVNNRKRAIPGKHSARMFMRRERGPRQNQGREPMLARETPSEPEV